MGGGEVKSPRRVTAYDAAYLWLARHTGASLLTLDGDMADAAVRWGLPLIG